MLSGDRFDAEETWRLIERWRVTNIFTVPTILKMLAEHPAALRIGLACDAQIRFSLPREPWDQPMDAVVTERRVLWTAGRSGEAFEETLS